jgi:N utilization substance protein A
MPSNAEFIDALSQLEREKGIDKETIIEALETSLVSACKKNFGASQNVNVIIDRENGNVEVYAQKVVVDDVKNSFVEISLEEAQKSNKIYQLGDMVDILVTPRNFGRIAAQTAKQVMVQKIRESERDILFHEFIAKEREIVFGKIQRREKKNIIIGLGKIEAILPPSEQIAKEEYNINDKLRVYVLKVEQTNKGPVICVSRTHPDLIKKLFELESPEVREGAIEIKSIAREPGARTKISVLSRDPNVDAVGACVGQNGYRVNAVVDELRGEKIDVVNYSDNPGEYICAALSPSKALSVYIDEETQSARIIVPHHQLSLAIGKEGQNARLAAKLTGWKIDIKSDKDFNPYDNAFDELDRAISAGKTQEVEKTP